MRNMSFALTTPQFRAHTKTVTRRNHWRSLKPHDHVMGVEKTMGLKKGERVIHLGPIIIIDVRREPLTAILNEPHGCAREGFPQWDDDPQMFIDMYCKHNGGDHHDYVTRIEYRYL
jgi:hypothetical protein